MLRKRSAVRLADLIRRHVDLWSVGHGSKCGAVPFHVGRDILFV